MNEWLLLAVMSLASYRATRLVVEDDFPPVLWMRDRLAGGWRELTASEERTLEVLPEANLTHLREVWSVDGESRFVHRWGWVPDWLAALVSCSWCASGWISMAAIGVAELTASVPAPVLTWGAVWGCSAILAAQDWA